MAIGSTIYRLFTTWQVEWRPELNFVLLKTNTLQLDQYSAPQTKTVLETWSLVDGDQLIDLFVIASSLFFPSVTCLQFSS